MASSRTVTVLVADVVSSTELFSRLGEDRADDARRALFEVFDAAVDAGGGVLVKTMGDGCLASFGAAADAVTAAVALQQQVAALRARAVPGLGVRVGLAVGDVTEEDGDIFGPAVVAASRLCSAAGEHQVLASEMVRMLAGSRGGHRYESAGELILKGLPDPVAACRVHVDAPTTTRRLPSALAEAPTEQVVGRDRELEVLVAAQKAAASGEQRAVLLAGEPGVGKTRLAAALARTAHDDGATVLFGRCEEDLAVPYQPFAEALQAAWADLPRAATRAHVAAHGGELARLVAGIEGPSPVRADPSLEQARLFDAVNDVLERAASEQPVVLVLDDLHWAAPATIALLRHLLGGSRDRRILVVGTYRDTEVDRSHALGGLLSDVHRIEGVERLALRGLDLQGIEELFVALSGDALDDDSRGLAAAVVERTAGNPFFVNQVLRHLVERGGLVQSDGRWTLHGELDDLDLPEGVLDVVGRRLSTLSEAANKAMSVGAVCGLAFSVRVLRAVAEAGEPDAVVDGLDEAVRARLLVETGPGQMAFTHAIVRDALLRELTTAKSARLHRAIGDAILEVYGDSPSLPLAELAHHFTEAALLGDTATAARWATAAADAAAAQADHHGSIALLQRALAVIEAVEPVDQAARFDVAVTISEELYQLAESDTAVAEVAADAARQLRSGERMLRVASSRYPGGTGISDPQRLSLYDQALALLPPEAVPLRVLARCAIAGHQAIQSDNRFVDDIDDLIALLPEVTAVAPRVGVTARSWLAFAMLGLPGAARRLQLADEGRAIPLDADDPWMAVLGSHTDMPSLLEGYRGHALMGLGRRAEFIDNAERLRTTAERTGNMSLLGLTEAQLALVALLDGRFDDAMGHVDRMVAASPGDMNFLLTYFAVRDQVLRERGELAESLTMADAATSISPDLAAVHALVARAALAVGDRARATDAVAVLLGRWDEWARDWSWPAVLASLPEVVVGLEDRAAAELLLAEVDPYAGELAVIGSGIYCGGAYDRFRGMLLDLLGRHDEAVIALEAALALERSIDAPVLTVRTERYLSLAVQHRDAAKSPEAVDAE